MAKKKEKKTAAKAKAKPPKKVAAKKKEEDSHRGDPAHSRFAYCRELIISQKHADEEILKAVVKRFPGAVFNQGYISSERWTINNALSKGAKKLERLYRHGDKLVTKDKLPAKEGKKKKYTSESDPLKRKAGIDVHKPKAAKPKAAKPKAVPAV